MTIYHNTILQMYTPFRSYYLAGPVAHITLQPRRFVQLQRDGYSANCGRFVDLSAFLATKLDTICR